MAKVAERVRPEAIATLAYEGGHPDHDSCSVLGARLGERLAVPVWETALYRRAQVSKFQGFKVSEVRSKGERRRGVGQGAWISHLPEKKGKQKIWHQTDPTSGWIERTGELRLQEFVRQRERGEGGDFGGGAGAQAGDVRAICVATGGVFAELRSGARGGASAGGYDYGRAPHEGRTNYECWQWWMSAREVSARLRSSWRADE